MLSVYNLSRSRVVLLDTIALLLSDLAIVYLAFIIRSISDASARFSFEAVVILLIIYAVVYILVMLSKRRREILSSFVTPMLIAGLSACLYVIVSIIYSSIQGGFSDLSLNLVSYIAIMLVIFLVTVISLYIVRSLGKLLSAQNAEV